MTYVPIYCDTARKREMERGTLGNETRRRRTRTLGLSLAQKVDGQWRCACCGKSVKVVA